jgi:hypothetical protein
MLAATYHFFALSIGDLFREYLPPRPNTISQFDDVARLNAAVEWLLKTIEVCGGAGSSKGYRVAKGWMSAYPETTGYLIPTLLNVCDGTDRAELGQIAERLGRWLASIQLPAGGFVGRELGILNEPVVFNTGQILHGFNALIYRRGLDDFRSHGQRAAEFLMGCMDASGCFAKNESNGIIHTYNVRTAWALLVFGRIAGNAGFQKAALTNAEWTLRQQNDDGFFLKNQFKAGGNANTHGLAYVLQGLMEFYRLTNDSRFLAAVRKTCDRLVRLYGTRRRLTSELGDDWKELSSHVCLTGYAQLAIVLFELYRASSDLQYLNTALHLLDDVSKTQDVRHRRTEFAGAIKGSRPVYGRYAPLQYPNWATKFYVDALLAKQRALDGDAYSVPVQLSAG